MDVLEAPVLLAPAACVEVDDEAVEAAGVPDAVAEAGAEDEAVAATAVVDDETETAAGGGSPDEVEEEAALEDDEPPPPWLQPDSAWQASRMQTNAAWRA